SITAHKAADGGRTRTRIDRAKLCNRGGNAERRRRQLQVEYQIPRCYREERRHLKVVRGARHGIKTHAGLQRTIRIIVATQRSQGSTGSSVNRKRGVIVAAKRIGLKPRVHRRCERKPHGLVSGDAEWIIRRHRCVSYVFRHRERDGWRYRSVVEIVIRWRWLDDGNGCRS